MQKVIEFAHKIIKDRISKNDICCDMTIGNGHDTLFLASSCKFVYGFDIQEQALINTKKLLKDNNKNNFQLFLTSHEFVDQLIHEKIKAFIYNLGYLPMGDKNITTNYKSTINSIIKALNLLDDKGVIALVIYPGHEQGKVESIEIEKYLASLNQKEFDVVTYKFINQINNPPYVIIIERRS